MQRSMMQEIRMVSLWNPIGLPMGMSNEKDRKTEEDQLSQLDALAM